MHITKHLYLKVKKVLDLVNTNASANDSPNPYGDDDFATPQEDTERMDIIGQNGNDGLHYDISDQDLIDDSDVEPNEPREENDPRPTLKGGIKIK